MISRNNTYEIDKVRWCIFVYALMKLIQYNYDDYIRIYYIFFTDETDEMGWYDEVGMVYVLVLLIVGC